MLLNEQNNLLQLRNFNIHRAKYLSFELCLSSNFFKIKIVVFLIMFHYIVKVKILIKNKI
jgi:hypothetical protein